MLFKSLFVATAAFSSIVSAAPTAPALEVRQAPPTLESALSSVGGVLDEILGGLGTGLGGLGGRVCFLLIYFHRSKLTRSTLLSLWMISSWLVVKSLLRSKSAPSMKLWRNAFVFIHFTLYTVSDHYSVYRTSTLRNAFVLLFYDSGSMAEISTILARPRSYFGSGSIIIGRCR